MHLNGALTVTDIMNLLLGVVVNIPEGSRKIMVGHMLESEFPKLFILVGIQSSMISRMFVASAVSEPNIIPFVGQHEGRSFVFVIDDPSVGTVKESMLKKYWFEARLNCGIFLLDAEHGENISIVSGDFMSLDGIVVVLAVVCEIEFGLGVSTPDGDYHAKKGDPLPH